MARHPSNDTERVKKLAQEIRQLLAQRDALQQKLFESHYETLFMLAFSIDQREGRFGLDVLATGLLSRHLAEELGLSELETGVIGLAAPLHDIGKVALSDAVLLKPTPWTEGEWLAYKDHASIGANMLLPFSQDPIMVMAEKIARHHHENWNGTGYPGKLTGTNIPLPARIVAVVDGYLSHAAYRSNDNHLVEGIALGVAIDDICKKSGLRYDPEVVQAFVRRVPIMSREYSGLLASKDGLMQQLAIANVSLKAAWNESIFKQED